jgi:hypothetical protein
MSGREDFLGADHISAIGFVQPLQKPEGYFGTVPSTYILEKCALCTDDANKLSI